MSFNVQNVTIKPHQVLWGAAATQVETITCVADVSSSLNNKYFFVYIVAGTKYHVWFNVASGGTDPAPAGSTAVAVAISANASAGTIATAVASALDALAGIVSTASGAVVTATQSTSGYASPAMEGSGTTFAFAVTTYGDSEVDVGYTDGNIEVKMEDSKVEVKAHQEGASVIAALSNGKKIEVTLNLKETSVAQIKKVLRQASATYTPVGATPTELVGWGTYGNFENLFNKASRLRLHPMKLDASDKTEDWTFMKAYAHPTTITFSGEEIFTIPLTFSCWLDKTLNSRIQYFAKGDSSQTLT